MNDGKGGTTDWKGKGHHTIKSLVNYSGGFGLNPASDGKPGKEFLVGE